MHLHTLISAHTYMYHMFQVAVEHLRDQRRDVEKAWSLEEHQGEPLTVGTIDKLLAQIATSSNVLMDQNEICKRHTKVQRPSAA